MAKKIVKEVEETKPDTRYPYTYAADCIRMVAGYNRDGAKISRCDAGVIRSLIATVTGIDDETLAKMIADYYLKNKELMEADAFRNFKATFDKE